MAKKNNLKKVESEPEGAQEIEAAQEIEVVEEVEEKPKKKREVTDAVREHLANIRVKALKVKSEKKLLREKAKELEKAELELKAQKYDNAVEEKNKLKIPPKQEVKEEVEEVIEEVKPKKVKKIVKKIIEESESEEEVQEVQEIIIRKKSNNINKSLTNNEKIKLAEQSAEDRLKQSLKEDRLNYLLNQIGCKL